jgi:hypothetical protein
MASNPSRGCSSRHGTTRRWLPASGQTAKLPKETSREVAQSSYNCVSPFRTRLLASGPAQPRHQEDGPTPTAPAAREEEWPVPPAWAVNPSDSDVTYLPIRMLWRRVNGCRILSTAAGSVRRSQRHRPKSQERKDRGSETGCSNAALGRLRIAAVRSLSQGRGCALRGPCSWWPVSALPSSAQARRRDISTPCWLRRRRAPLVPAKSTVRRDL